MNRFLPGQVIDLVNRYGSTVSTDYYVNTAHAESGFDADNVTKEGNGTTSIGLFQANASEATEAGEDPGQLKDPNVNARVFIWHVERNAAYIRQFTGQDEPPDLGAYLGLAWNQGYGALQKTLQAYGYDYPAYVRRNSTNFGLLRALAYMDGVNFDSSSVPPGDSGGIDGGSLLAELGLDSFPSGAGEGVGTGLAVAGIAVAWLLWG